MVYLSDTDRDTAAFITRKLFLIIYFAEPFDKYLLLLFYIKSASLFI